jgi:hypothetical protein
MRLSPEAHFSQTDVARVIFEFAAHSLPALGRLRLVCRYWSELVRVAEDYDEDTWMLQLLRGALRCGTLGSDCSHEDAIKFFTGDSDYYRLV